MTQQNEGGNPKTFPRIMDLSAVQSRSTLTDVKQTAAVATEFDCKAVICLACFLDALHEERSRLGGRFLIGGTVGYPSGQTTTSMKVAEAEELLRIGVDEVDMMMNDGFLLSGMEADAETDIRAVKETIGDIPLKVIVESPILSPEELRRAAEIVVRGGAQWIKTSTGWMPTGTTLDHLKIIKETVGEAIQIKVAGGVGSLAVMETMIPYGVGRFGIGRSARKILEEIFH